MKKAIILTALCLLLTGCSEKELPKELKKETISLSAIKEKLEFVNASDYSDIFSDAIEKIKEVDKDFNYNDYKLVYEIEENEDNILSYVKFYYYINGYIKTNKVYTVNYNNYEITDNDLECIDEFNNSYSIKENSSKCISYEFNKEEITEKITNFEKDKALTIYNSLGEYFKNEPTDNTITADNLLDTVTFSDDYYFYNFINNKLTYEVDVNIKNDSKNEPIVIIREIEL